jgi:hypothetical protein
MSATRDAPQPLEATIAMPERPTTAGWRRRLALLAATSTALLVAGCTADDVTMFLTDLWRSALAAAL